ncbi:MAG: sugar ABC transporter substrate-binding protein [Actinomycetota bacterium]
MRRGRGEEQATARALRRSRHGLVILLLLSTSIAAGCRGEPRAASTRLSVFMANDWGGAPAVLDAVAEFERRHRDVRVEIRKVQFEFMADTVRAAIDAGTPPDVVQWHAFAGGAQGLAEQLDGAWKGIDDGEFIPGSVEDVTWGAHRYGIPLDTNAMLLLYDLDRFSSVGASAPTNLYTFGQLEALARRLSQADRKAIAIPESTWHTYGWIKANGGEVVEVGENGRPVFTFGRAESVEAVAFLRKLIADGAAFPPEGVAGDRVDAFALFKSGLAGLHATGSWDLPALKQAGRGVGIMQMPAGMRGTSTGTSLGGSSLFVGRGSRQRTLAIEFMHLLTSDRYALRLAAEEGRLPVRLRLYTDPLFASAEMQAFSTQLRSAHPFRLEAFPPAHQEFQRALENILVRGADPAGTLGAAETKANRSITQ